MQSIHGGFAHASEPMPDTLALFVNQAPVSNQVGGNQIVHGSIYNAPITLIQSATEPIRDAQPGAVDLGMYDNDILQLLAFPRMLDRRSNVDPPHADTCQWILDLAEFSNWKSQSRGLLWIKGNPGVGKSVLMAYLCNELRQKRSPNGVYLDFFFNARGDELQKSPLGMLRSLLNQLFRQDPDSCSPLRASYKEKYAAFGRSPEPGWDMTRQELESLLTQCVLHSAQQRQVTIFVDALDEAGEIAARGVAHYLHLLNDRVSANAAKARICISSRHHPVSSTVPGVEIVVESYNRDDIAAFVHSRLNLEYRTLEDTPDLDQWYDLKKDLCERANGIFQWVCLVVPILEQYLDQGDSLEDARKLIDKVPESLEKAYEHIVREVIDPRHRIQSYLLFRWICLAKQPLSVTTLRYALAAGYARPPPSQIRCSQTPYFIRTDKLMRTRLRTLSGGLVAVINDRTHNTVLHDGLIDVDRFDIATELGTTGNVDPCIVQPIHLSVNDFFLEKGLALLASLLDRSPTKSSTSNSNDVSPDEVSSGHAMIYWSCLKYLCSEDPEDSPDLEDVETHILGLRSNKNVVWQCSEPSKVHILLPFAQYALTWLPAHALAARDARGQETGLQANLIQIVLDQWMKTIHSAPPGSSVKVRITALHVAAFANLSDLLEHFLKDENDLEARNANGYTALHIAAERGHEAVAKRLVRAGAALEAKTCLSNGQYHDDMTPLALAAAHGHVSLVRWLLHRSQLLTQQISSELSSKSARDDLSHREDSICIALDVAAEHGYLEIVKILIDAGAKLDMKFGKFGTPLQAASRFGHSEIVQSLIKAHADVNILGGRYGSALMAACRKGDIGIVRNLLRSGAVVNIVTEGKKAFALQQACEKGHMKIVTLLLSHGADVNLEGGTYGYALHAAAYFNHTSIVRLLLNAGANVNAVGGRYGTALLAASSFNNSMDTIRLLLDAGAHIDAMGNTPYTPLQLAAWRAGSADLVRFLLDAGADVNAPGSRECTALQAAVMVSCDIFHGQGPSEVVAMLLDAGADVNALGGRHGTVLEIAARFKDQRMLDFLVGRGAIPADPDSYTLEFFSNLDKWEP